MVSGDEHCIVDSECSLVDHISLSHCNASSLDLNSYSTRNVLHARVDSPCISTPHDDMLALSCCHDKNALFSSSICVTNNVEETKATMGQDKILDGASITSSSSSSHGSYTCLMAMDSKVSPPLEPSLSSDDEDDDMEELNVASLNMMGELVSMLFLRINLLALTILEGSSILGKLEHPNGASERSKTLGFA